MSGESIPPHRHGPDPARERLRLGVRLQARREVEQVDDLFAGEIGEIKEAM
jgi:hypothetical protein